MVKYRDGGCAERCREGRGAVNVRKGAMKDRGLEGRNDGR